MGITCKDTGKFKGIMKKLDNQLATAKAERVKKTDKENLLLTKTTELGNCRHGTSTQLDIGVLSSKSF